MLAQFNRLLFPAECVDCQIEGDWLCADCRRSLKPGPDELCRICGKFGRTGICQRCQAATGLDGVISLFKYAEPSVQKLIKIGKYAGQSDALSFFTATYRTKLLRQLPDDSDSTFSFVPLDRGRFAERGFNQAELIARLLAAKEFPVQSVFRKLKPTPHQAELDSQDRRKNLGKVFTLVGSTPERLVICDDVITTGTTLGRLAKLAKKAGAQEVWAVTLAHS